MSRFAEPMQRLIDEFRKLPGVGTRTAQRFAFHVLRSPDADANALAQSIRALKQSLRLCDQCNNVTDAELCSICAGSSRNSRQICIVEEPTNIAGVEKTRSYNGLYHVLHGTLSPVHGVGPEQLRLRNLWPRLSATDELIVATSPTVEGEATARYIFEEARRQQPDLLITRIATGVPAGSDIEYVDEVTMTRALEGRRGL